MDIFPLVTNIAKKTDGKYFIYPKKEPTAVLHTFFGI